MEWTFVQQNGCLALTSNGGLALLKDVILTDPAIKSFADHILQFPSLVLGETIQGESPQAAIANYYWESRLFETMVGCKDVRR